MLIDSELQLFTDYDNLGWPARYLFNQDGRLFEYHFGEGAYDETERAIAELLGIEVEPLAPIRPEDEPGALLVAQSDDVPGPYSGPYEAGGVWAVLEGAGTVVANGVTRRGRPPRRLRADPPSGQHRRHAGAGDRRRRHLPRRLLHPRPRAVASSSRPAPIVAPGPASPRRPSSLRARL